MEWIRRSAAAVNRARDGLALDAALYLATAAFAVITAAASTLESHRAWGELARYAYLLAAFVALCQLVVSLRRPGAWFCSPAARGLLAVLTSIATALVPLVALAVSRAAGDAGRAQEEVPVIEDGARRLLETGTPYLDRDSIAALPTDDRLLGYLPYQPGMVSFGLPRALAHGGWWSDARFGFALVTVAALAAAFVLLRRAGAEPAALVRALQVVAVVPICALTLATGGDDLPVLALCLLGFSLAASGRIGWAGVAIGAAAALKLLAWPVALVLGVALRRQLGRYAIGAAGLPLLTLVPALLVDANAVVENLVRFPTGRGLVTSPAASPLPGHLIASSIPGGRTVALGLLLLTGAAFAAWLVRRPPESVAAACVLSGLGLLTAIMLLPATRFGYLLYPVALLGWAPALRLRRVPEVARTVSPLPLTQ